MPLPSEQIYNDLNGEECKEILVRRFLDLLTQSPYFMRHLTLPRVKMSLIVHLELWGCTPPELDITDEVVIRTRDLQAEPELADEATLETEIDAFSNPPDKLREEHGIPIPTPTRNALGYTEDKPILREGVKYAAFVEQDRGGPAVIVGPDAPFRDRRTLDHAKFNPHRGAPEAPFIKPTELPDKE